MILLSFQMLKLPVNIITAPELTLENASDTSESSKSRRVSQVSCCSSTQSFNPPEFVLCMASDSDSSRRVSRCSELSSQRPSCQWDDPHEPHESHIKLSRRCSLAVPTSPMTGSVHLDVPQLRDRNYSLPSTVLSEELYKMRMFSVQGKKVVNHGDMIQSRRGSRSSVSSRGSADSHSTSLGHPNSPSSGRSSALSSRGASRSMSRQSSSPSSYTRSRRNSDRGYASSYRTSPLSAHSRCSSPCLLQLDEPELDTPPLVKVLILGVAGVGKSSLCAQFSTSDYVNTYHHVGENFEYIIIC